MGEAGEKLVGLEVGRWGRWGIERRRGRKGEGWCRLRHVGRVCDAKRCFGQIINKSLASDCLFSFSWGALGSPLGSRTLDRLGTAIHSFSALRLLGRRASFDSCLCTEYSAIDATAGGRTSDPISKVHPANHLHRLCDVSSVNKTPYAWCSDYATHLAFQIGCCTDVYSVTLRERLRATVHGKIFKMTLMCIICRLSMACRAQIAVISPHIYTPQMTTQCNAQAPLPYSTDTTHNPEVSSTPMSPQFSYISSIHTHSQLPSLSD